MSATEYEFEMFDLRKELLAMVAENAREDQLHRARNEGARRILTRGEGNVEKAAKAFKTSFDKAKEIVEKGGDHDLEIEEMPAILEDHDGEIQPGEIDGKAVELIRSIDQSGFGEPQTSLYPVVDHPSGYRVCTCPSQKYYVLCPHTLARVIERNWPEAPLPDDVYTR